jgi:L-alanine-DL-glutamate epimerase-like enolase superfamily enzyme
MPDLTIHEVRTTLLRGPWPDDPWLAGHPLGPLRELVVVEIVTAAGLTGMGYLHPLDTSLLRTLGTCIDEALTPRLIGRNASAVEAIGSGASRSGVRSVLAPLATSRNTFLHPALVSCRTRASTL